MKQEINKMVEDKLNSLKKQPPRRNPLAVTIPPYYPKVGPYSAPRAMTTNQAAIQILAAFKNVFSIESEITEEIWNRKVNSMKEFVIHYADKCWLYCNADEADGIVKSILEMKGLSFPPKTAKEEEE